jgi:protein-tyrosine phosphatase
VSGERVPLSELIGGVGESIILDLRPGSLYAESHLDGAINVTIAKVSLVRLKKAGSVINSYIPVALHSRQPHTTIILYNEKGDKSDIIETLKDRFQQESPLRLVGTVVGGFAAIIGSGAFKIQSSQKSHFDMAMKRQLAPPKQEPEEGPDFNYITDRLAVGAETVAHNTDLLRSQQFTHVLNVSSLAPMENSGVTCLWISMNDSVDQPIFGLVPDCITFIDTALKTPSNKVLVHCQAGISRSVTITIIYFMWSEGLSLDGALEKVSNKRSKASPNLGFMGQMMILEKALGVTRDITDACRIAEQRAQRAQKAEQALRSARMLSGKY